MSSTGNSGNKLNQLMLAEFQLVAEQKWIQETLNKIRKQRNALEVERLQLESLKVTSTEIPMPTSVQKETDNVKVETPVKPSTSQNNTEDELEEDLDDIEAYKRKQLDLSIMNHLDSILEGNFLGESEEESEEEDI